MNPRPTPTEAREHLRALLEEKEQIEAYLAEVPKKEARLSEMKNGWHQSGEIEQARYALRDSVLPVWKDSQFDLELIASVDDKWITIRRAGYSKDDDTIYNRQTGIEKGKRANWRESIDVARAVHLWAAHLRTVDASPAGGCGASASKPKGAQSAEETKP